MKTKNDSRSISTKKSIYAPKYNILERVGQTGLSRSQLTVTGQQG